MRFLCHFQRICPFFFQRLELRFIFFNYSRSSRLENIDFLYLELLFIVYRLGFGLCLKVFC